MIDHLRINDRIAEIRRRLRQLKESLETVSEHEFIEKDELVDATDHRLQIAIQACMDIASHIVAEMALEKPQKESKEVFMVLAREDIVADDLAKRLVAMGGMRNILVHQYMEVDDRKVYQAIKHDLGDIEEFVAQIQKFLDSQDDDKSSSG